MASVPGDYLRAARRYGPLVDRIAAQYTNPVTGKPLSGAALLVKLGQGESGFRADAVSSAGARGETQFMPASRRTAIDRFGVDPWRSTDEAVHAAALHLLGRINGSKGLEGFNPGSPGYTDYILGQRVGGVGGGSSGGSSSGGSSGSSSPAVQVPQAQIPAPSAALTSALLAEQAAPRSVGQLALPAFAARPTLPAGAAVLGSTPAPSRSDALAGALAQIRATQVEMPAVAVPSSAGGSTGGGGSSAPKGSGEVVVASTADRSGVGVRPIVKDFVRSVADHGGRTIEITTGTNHNRLTVNGRVSDHWDGHAADIGVPVDSKRGDVIAAHALQEAGVPWGQAIKMAQHGGLYTLTPDRGTYKGRRIQVIWKTYEGGNHHNHVHIGIR